MLAGMSTEPVELDSGLLGRVRDVAEGNVRPFVEAAVRRALDNAAFGRLLDELEAEVGPVPGEVSDEAERLWHAS